MQARSLSSRQAEIVSWLEAEGRRSVTSRDVVNQFHWPEPMASNVLSDLATKQWLRRVGRGIYEFLAAEGGGFKLDDPWPALATWSAKHYVGFRSAAYQHGLTPDRPGRVQVAVPFGVQRPRSWGETPITLLHQRDYSEDGIQIVVVAGWQVRASSPERTVLDGAIQPKRLGGIADLARVVSRAHRNLDWAAVLECASKLRRGGIGLRRLGALTDLLELSHPEDLEGAVGQPSSRLYLGETATYGAAGRVLKPWNVVDNVGPRVRGELSR